MRKKRIVFLISTSLFWFSLYVYVPQLTNYARELGASYKLVGLIGAAYGLTQTIFRIPIGILSDKIKKRKIFILIGTICIFISSILLYTRPKPYFLLLARLISGLGAATWVNFTILYLSYYSPEESSKSIGIVTSMSKFGQLAAMFIGGFIAIQFGMRAVFLLSIIVSLISFFISLFIYEKRVEKEQNLTTSLPGTSPSFINERVLSISILGSLIQFITYATTFGFTPIIAASLGANNLQLAFLTTLFTIPQVIFPVLANTIISKKLGQKLTLLIGFLLTTIVCFATPFAPNLTTLYILQIISGIGNAIVFSLLMAMVISGVRPETMTTTMGFFQATYGVGMILGPVVLGNIGDLLGLSLGFIVVGILGIAAMVAVIKLKLNNDYN